MPNNGKDFVGITAVIRSPSPTWQSNGASKYGMIFMPLYTNASWGRPFLLEAGQTSFHSSPFPSSVRRNKNQLSNPFDLTPITSLMVVSIFWDDKGYTLDTSAPYYLATTNEGWNADLDIGDLIAWSTLPSEADLIAAENWMMEKYQI